MRRFLSGLLVGIIITFGASAFAAEVEQFILTRAQYPIVVNGAEYHDDEYPILNYNGRTYIPLAKIADLLGVNYVWNGELNRVEINTGVSVPLSMARELAERQAIEKFTEQHMNYEIVEPEVVGYKGFSDEADVHLVLAQINGLPLPPRLSEGWVCECLLSDIFSIVPTVGSDPQHVTYIRPSLPPKVVLELQFPDGWGEQQSGEITLDGIRIRRHNGVNYFNIADLEQRLQ